MQLEEHQSLDTGLVRRADQVHLYRQIFIEEVGPKYVVGLDAADLGGCYEDVVGPLPSHKRSNRALVHQVQFTAGAHQEISVATGLQAADERRAHHAAVARHVDLRVTMHVNSART